MKTLVLLLLINTISLISLSQETYVPDDNFEAYLESNSMGNGIPNDNYVTTANISNVNRIDIGSYGVSDLTGIEDFISIDTIIATINYLTTIDFTQNTELKVLDLSYNYLTSLNLSSNAQLIWIDVNYNELTCLNIKNGNNTNFIGFRATNNFLTCIEVDDVSYATANFSNIDGGVSFSSYCSNDCSYFVGIDELDNSEKRNLVKVLNLLGQEVEPELNKVLIYVYSDGSTEKVFISK